MAVLLVTVVSLYASHTFISLQQQTLLAENTNIIKSNHQRSVQTLFEQRLKDQILSAEEILLLSGLRDMREENLQPFFDDVWPRLQKSYSLSSMSFENAQRRIILGPFPNQEMVNIHQAANDSLHPQSAIICHVRCELVASIPLKRGTEQWVFSLISDISSSIIFLNSVAGSDIGIIAPSKTTDTSITTLARYNVDMITNANTNKELFDVVLSDEQITGLDNGGIHINTDGKNYFVWFEQIAWLEKNIKLLFIHDISLFLEHQSNHKNQVILVFSVLTLSVLAFLIAFSILPLSRLSKLKGAIQLIGSKDYKIAKTRLGEPSKSFFNDELHALEHEFRLTIDVLESYEHQLTTSQKRLVRQATIDPTTGLFTRNVLIEDLEKMVNDDTITDVSIFFLDLDGFKPINDNLGHEAGDIMLKKIGYRLKGVVNQSTKVYRIGGDEFVICYSNVSATHDIGKMADGVVGLFCAPFHIYDTNISISASIGIAMQNADHIDADQLLRYADIAMYQAKERGKNRYEFFNDSMRDAAHRRFIVKNDFVVSLAEQQLFVVFQPIVCSTTRRVVKLEALCRWQHPDLGFIPPPIFIDVLEESENMNVLFEWIVKNVIQEILYLDSIGRDDVVISVNLSTSQLVNFEALELIQEMIIEHNINASRIELEITETTLITNFEQAKEWVKRASNIGFKIAIDDFGAGYSSLSYLTAFEYNTVKLDRSLLNRVDDDKRQQRIVGSLTQMLHGLSVPIVAEGAETEAQFTQLKTLGCDFIQGFLISEPIAHDDLVLFLANYKHSAKAINV